MTKSNGGTKTEADDGVVPPSSTTIHDDETATPQDRPRWRRIYERVYWVPPNCRWDPDSPPKFSMPLNILFAFASAFTVANLYYNHPILNLLSRDFDVPYDKVAQIPTVAQAGYAGGLFFLCPLGDLLKRRPFVLSLVFVTATLSIGLCLTPSFVTFSALQFIIGFTTVTPQLMLPLVGDLAPPKRRAAALSIVVSGFVLGILIARLLSGVMSNYVSWRYVYWLSVGLQYAIFINLWLFMPDYPSTNKQINYFRILWSMLVMVTKHPVLVQASIISMLTSSTFTCFWTVLTFLLSGAPYNYDTVNIGLFALIGIATMFFVPFYGRYVIDRFVPWFSVILGMMWAMLGICLGAYLGEFTVAGPILQAWFLDLGVQTSQVANRTSIYSIEPNARNRVNTVFMVCVFFGQLIGTSAGAHIYVLAGWKAAQSYSVAAIGVALLICFSRGPYETHWVGWRGGLSIFKKNRETADGLAEVKHKNPLRRMTTNEKAAEADLEKAETQVADGPGQEMAEVEDDSRGRSEADEASEASVGGKTPSKSEAEDDIVSSSKDENSHPA